mmetsp:Transcript_541/g.815  ORF Transcript_541/g.815 Transcript_541/m.815 type:complete len:559 (-) Transcript_541:424-2100(-)
MSSRGRGVNNAPAWMTRGADVDRDDFGRHRRGGGTQNGHPDHPPPYNRGPPPPMDHRGSRAPFPPRGGGGDWDRRRGPPPSRGEWDNRRGPPPRGPGGHHRGGAGPRRPPKGGVHFNSFEEERAWVDDRRRKRLSRKSLWDVPPTADQAAMDARAAAMTNFAATDFSGVDPNSNLPQQTRHARRLYVGNLPPNLSEDSLQNFFREAIDKALVKKIDEDPILSVYINQERRFCFLEFKSVEMTSACMALDGINIMGRGKVKVKRPNDYNPSMAPISANLPEMDVSKLGIISSTVPDGPHKIFIGGLHYHLTEEQVLELLGAFGKVKAFHLVKQDPDATTSKGYCFVEYIDKNVTQVAVVGLNGMDLGQGKILTARIANEKDNAMVAPLVAAQQQAPNLSGQYNVEELVDAAMGMRPMPTAPSLLGLPVVPLVPISTPVVASALDIAKKALAQAFPNQTRILVLMNLVSDEDLANDQECEELIAEVRDECAKYGTLLSVKIPRSHDAGIEPSAVKKVFLEYDSVQVAVAAESELNGRSFGPNNVQTSFFSEEDYAKGSLR